MSVDPASDEVPIDRAFCRREEMQELGRRLLRDTVSGCGAAEATLWVTSADGQHLDAALNHGLKPDVVEALSVPVADSVVGMVACTGAASCIGPEDYQNPTVVEATGIKVAAMAAAPVYVKGHLCGVISTINPQESAVFEAKQLDVLQWKAYLMGLIILDCRDSTPCL
jgi:GAF domain